MPLENPTIINTVTSIMKDAHICNLGVLHYDKINEVNIDLHNNKINTTYYLKAPVKTDGSLQSLCGKISLNFESHAFLILNSDVIFKEDIMIDLTDVNKFIYFDKLSNSICDAEYLVEAFTAQVTAGGSKLSVPCKVLVNTTNYRNANKSKAGVVLKIHLEFCYNTGFILEQIDVYSSTY